ncbi:amino acid permease [Seonamhaeicola sediminis]|uniref:Amino acid permease n=1 Tax=Seonamhaeicola sediminis TaxID=2528206 RepID=A0A562YEB2_9FLAO|nr:APC family permease [Seonamhaeicola sediminis]TWO32663.1 amino acid permease [Seonamhaeicola sediminis]
MIIEDKGLKRRIGVLGLSANIVNIIIGSGIFVLPAIVAGYMGASSILAYLFCGFLMAMIMLCFAEVGSKVTNTGGPYTYIEAAFGDYAGFISGFFVIVTFLFADAAVSNALLDVLTTILPILSNSWIRPLALFILFFGLASINILGIKQGIGLVKFNTITKLIPLIVLVFVGFSDISINNLALDNLPSASTLGKTSLILFFAFQGCETGLIAGGEVINPKRTIPRAIFVSLTTVIVVYILIQTVAQGILGSNLPNFKAAPLAETAKVVFGSAGFTMLIIGAVISMFGYMSGSILNSPRVVYALSRDRVLPIKGLAKIHKSFATPYIAILFYTTLGYMLSISGSFEQLAVIATSSMLFVYLGVVFSVIKLRISIKNDKSSFKIPGGLLVPILAIIIILFFLSNISYREMIGTIVFIGLLSLIYFIRKAWLRKKF